MNEKASQMIDCPNALCEGILRSGENTGDLVCDECGSLYYIISRKDLCLIQKRLHDALNKAKKMNFVGVAEELEKLQ